MDISLEYWDIDHLQELRQCTKKNVPRRMGRWESIIDNVSPVNMEFMSVYAINNGIQPTIAIEFHRNIMST